MTKSERRENRVLLLELDSLSLAFIHRHLDALPVFKALLTSGEVVHTASTGDIASASVWPTFNAGKLPGDHGHYFPFQWHQQKLHYYRPYKSAWKGELEYEPFWYGLARDGQKCQVLDAVQCIPAADSPCLEIHDWSSQSSGTALSTDHAVLKELKSRFGARPIGAEVPVTKSYSQSSSLFASILASLKKKSEAIIWLGQSRDWQFYLASIQDIHRAGHNLWPAKGEFTSDVDSEALLTAYQALDREVGTITDALVDDRTFPILFTLNGMSNNRAQNHLLPQILSGLNRQYLCGETGHDVSTHRSGIFARLRDGIPPGIQLVATRVLGENVQDWVVNREFKGGLSWSETPSFTLPTGGEGLIRLNVRGRERDGMLSMEDGSRDEYVAWLRDRVMAIKDTRTGGRLVQDFVEVQKLYPGPKAHLLPDIALIWAPEEPATEVISPDIGRVRSKLRTGRGGNHTGEAFAILPQRTAATGIGAQLEHITDYAAIVEELLAQKNPA